MSQFDINGLSEETDETTLFKTCSEFVSHILSREKTFLQLIESLEPLLSNADLNKHTLGIEILSTVMKLLPKDLFSGSELDFITQFLCAQVKQHHSFISSSLKGIYCLVQNQNLTRESLHIITSTLFGNVVWQTQVLEDRKTFYSILQYIVFNRIEDFQTTNSEFLFNIISSVDGERDPRNLLLLFSFLPKLYTSIPLGPLAEDAFEVVSCYFPIDFHGASADGGTVTREDLVSALTPCLLASPDFSPHCISLIQEKLDSTMKSAKIDSYNLLREGCSVWSASVLDQNCESLWICVKQDTLPPRDAQVADAAVLALQALVKASSEPSLSSLLKAITRSCEGFLTDVQMNMFEPSSRLLLSTMQASPPACEFVSIKLLPVLVSLLKIGDESSKIIVLNKLLTFVQVGLANNLNLSSGAVEDSWRQLSGELCKCLVQGSAEVKQTAYTLLTIAAGHLDTTTRQNIYPALLSLITSEQSSSIRFAGLKLLQNFASLYGDEIQTNIAQNIAANNSGEQGDGIKHGKLEAICALSMVERFQPLLSEQVTSQLPVHTTSVISTLRNFLEMEEVQENSSLMRFLFSESPIISSLINLQTSRDDVFQCSRIIQTLVRLQTPSDQERIVTPLVKIVLQNPDLERRMVYLEALLAALWSQVKILSNEEVRQLIVPAALLSEDQSSAQQYALQLLSSLINKADSDELLELVASNLKHCSPDQAIIVQSYITKALLLRNHPQMEHWLNEMLSQLNSPELGEKAADGFQLILQDSEFLSSKNHCLVRLLYRQRLFHLVFPKLVQNTNNRTLPHLRVWSYLLSAVPHAVYASYIKQMTPLLVLSLDTECESLLRTVLSTLVSLLATDQNCLLDHIDTFIPRFLHLAKHNQFMQVRITAIRCLSNCLKFPSSQLLPHKQQVISELIDCLDDKKRLVRKEAARTRSKWFLLGAPSPDS